MILKESHSVGLFPLEKFAQGFFLARGNLSFIKFGFVSLMLRPMFPTFDIIHKQELVARKSKTDYVLLELLNHSLVSSLLSSVAYYWLLSRNDGSYSDNRGEKYDLERVLLQIVENIRFLL